MKTFQEKFRSLIVGQDDAVNTIIPYVELYASGLAPVDRPAGVFLLLGPTGTGKTRTVEALAEALHGSAKRMLKIDCAEFQMEHEVAKLTGAPPGYLGHRETQPILTQTKINAVTSEDYPLSILLFDEIEKAASSMQRILLGILDKAELRLGDNNRVNFERTLIFLTSNLGARDFAAETGIGLGPAAARSAAKNTSIASRASRKYFAPEFINRIDATLTYQPLTAESMGLILDQQLTAFANHVFDRLGPRAFSLHLTSTGREKLLSLGTSATYGARELKRVIHREIIQSASALLIAGKIEPQSALTVDCIDGRITLVPAAEKRVVRSKIFSANSTIAADEEDTVI
jgi:ATP-dependent Clp protease ATP-binding subunit ClpA